MEKAPTNKILTLYILSRQLQKNKNYNNTDILSLLTSTEQLSTKSCIQLSKYFFFFLTIKQVNIPIFKFFRKFKQKLRKYVKKIKREAKNWISYKSKMSAIRKVLTRIYSLYSFRTAQILNVFLKHSSTLIVNLSESLLFNLNCNLTTFINRKQHTVINNGFFSNHRHDNNFKLIQNILHAHICFQSLHNNFSINSSDSFKFVIHKILAFLPRLSQQKLKLSKWDSRNLDVLFRSEISSNSPLFYKFWSSRRLSAGFSKLTAFTINTIFRSHLKLSKYFFKKSKYQADRIPNFILEPSIGKYNLPPIYLNYLSLSTPVLTIATPFLKPYRVENCNKNAAKNLLIIRFLANITLRFINKNFVISISTKRNNSSLAISFCNPHVRSTFANSTTGQLSSPKFESSKLAYLVGNIQMFPEKLKKNAAINRSEFALLVLLKLFGKKFRNSNRTWPYHYHPYTSRYQSKTTNWIVNLSNLSSILKRSGTAFIAKEVSSKFRDFFYYDTRFLKKKKSWSVKKFRNQLKKKPALVHAHYYRPNFKQLDKSAFKGLIYQIFNVKSYFSLIKFAISFKTLFIRSKTLSKKYGVNIGLQNSFLLSESEKEAMFSYKYSRFSGFGGSTRKSNNLILYKPHSFNFLTFYWPKSGIKRLKTRLLTIQLWQDKWVNRKKLRPIFYRFIIKFNSHTLPHSIKKIHPFKLKRIKLIFNFLSYGFNPKLTKSYRLISKFKLPYGHGPTSKYRLRRKKIKRQKFF